MIRNKKAVIEVQFNWVFIIIIGAVILAFFVSMSMKQKGVSEQELSVTIAEHMKTILTSAEVTERSVNLITVPNKDITYECGTGFSVSSMASFNPKIIFAPSPLKSQSQKLITWSLDWNVPFRVTNFLYLTSPDILYILVHDFGDIRQGCPDYAARRDVKCVSYDGASITTSETRRRIDTNDLSSPTGPCWCGGAYITGANDDNKGYCCAGGELTTLDNWRCYNLNNPSESLSGNDCCMKVDGATVGFCPCRGVVINNAGTLTEDSRTPPCVYNRIVDRECICGGELRKGAGDNFAGFCCPDGAFINTVNLAMRLNKELPNHPAFRRTFVSDVAQIGAELTKAQASKPYKVKMIFFNYNKAGRDVNNKVDVDLTKVKDMPDADVTAIHITKSENTLDDYGLIQFYKKSGDHFVADGAALPFLKKEALIGAVFADSRETYACNMKKAFDRLNMMSRLYYERTDELSKTTSANCQGYYSDPKDFFNWAYNYLKYDSYDDIKKAYNSIYTGSTPNYKPMILKDLNHNLQLESCPLIY